MSLLISLSLSASVAFATPTVENNQENALDLDNSISYITRGGPKDYCRKTGGVWTDNKCVKKKE